MIVTITMNPSVDISYKLDQLTIDGVNRVTNYSKTAGGKGLNVARVLAQLEQPVTATGVLGGTIGDFIKQNIVKDNVEDGFLTIEKESRNCIAIIHDDGKQTEILEAGPTLSEQEGENFLTHLTQLLTQNSKTVTVSGSLPKGLSVDYYTKVIALCNREHCKVILDSSGNYLMEVLKHKEKPYVIKPNLEEIESIVGQSLPTTDDQVKALSHKNFDGIMGIVLSKGKDGAIVKWGKDFYAVSIPKVQAVNPVGSGDSTVAGIAMGVELNYSPEEIIQTAMTAGILNAMEEKTGHINKENFETIVKQIQIKKL
ncbi:hexose kinase [Lacticigenium naphthae]|uniref:hexose kinase n=1 Tax=Lacticigenium naphthae TaxID=515351 RepID=UPI0003FB7DA2|nr:hexose kinase [Lacticigenium naphthae]